MSPRSQRPWNIAAAPERLSPNSASLRQVHSGVVIATKTLFGLMALWSLRCWIKLSLPGFKLLNVILRCPCTVGNERHKPDALWAVESPLLPMSGVGAFLYGLIRTSSQIVNKLRYCENSPSTVKVQPVLY